MITLNRNKKLVRVVTFALLQVFLGWNLSSAAVSDRSLWHQRGKLTVGTSVSGNSLVQEDLQKSLFADFFVPEAAGTINEFWVPAGMTTQEALSSSKLLIHVRDAHCNYEAQGNIAKIIDNFAKANGVNFVAVEGAEGKIDYSLLNAFPDYNTRREVTDAFMELGRLCGAEFANINADKYTTLFGAEKESVYDSNLANFRNTLTYKEEGLKFVSQVKSALEALKAQMFTPELKDIEEKLALYNNREISFVDYCQYLYNLPAAENIRSGYKNFALLMEAIRAQELVDFSQIDSEKTALMNELARTLTTDELRDLSQASIDFQRGKISTAAYYHLLQELAAEKKIDLAAYKNLKPYMVYLNVYEKINSADLFKEKETLEAEVKRGLFKNLDQARLDKLSKNADILEKIFSVRLTNDDLAYFKNNRTDFTAYEFESFINEQAPKSNVAVNIDFSADPLEKYLSKLEAFYNEAKTRDDLLVQNVLSQMDLEGSNVGVLVAGGFHTAGMTATLRSKNIPYMVVTPRILKEDVNNPYLKLITGEMLPVEKLLTVEHLFSLAVKINAGDQNKVISTAMALDPDTAPEETRAWIKQAKERGHFVGDDNIQKGTVNGVPVVFQTVGNEIRITTDAKNQAAVDSFLASANVTAKSVETLGKSTVVARANDKEGQLKGKIEAETLKALRQPIPATVVAQALPDFVRSNAGLSAVLAVIVTAAKGMVPPAVQSAVDAISVETQQDINAFPYPSLPQPKAELATALADQHEVVIVDNKVRAAGLILAIAAARAQLGDSNAVKIAAAKLAHDAYEVSILTGKVAQEAGSTAHDQAKAKIDQVVLPSITDLAGVDNLAQLGTFLDTPSPSQAVLDANKALAEAASSFLEKPSAANAANVVLAEARLRDLKGGATEQTVAKADRVLVATALATISEGKTVQIVLGDKSEVAITTAAAAGQEAKVTRETLPKALEIPLTASKVSTVAFAADVKPAAQAEVLANLTAPNADVKAVASAAAAETVGTTVAREDGKVVAVFVGESAGVRETFASIGQVLVANRALQAAPISKGKPEQYGLIYNTDDATNPASEEALVRAVEDLLVRNISIQVVLMGTKAAAIQSRLPADQRPKVQLNPASIDENVMPLKNRVVLSSTPVGIAADKTLTLSRPAANEAIPYEAATTIAAYWAFDSLAAYTSVLEPLLVQLGLPVAVLNNPLQLLKEKINAVPNTINTNAARLTLQSA